MKRILLLVLTLLLVLLPAAVPACAEEQEATEAELYDLWNSSGESRTWIAGAVPVADGVLIAGGPALPADPAQITVSDGQSAWTVRAVIPDSSGLLNYVFYDPAEVKPRYGAWTLVPFGDSVSTADCVVRTADENGGRSSAAVLSAESIEWRGRRCLLLNLSEVAPAGSPVLTSNGQLMGIVAASYAEGTHRVLALATEEIARGLNEMTMKLANLAGWGNMPEGFTVSTEKNRVTFDWNKLTLPEKAEGESVYLVIVDSGNNYLNFYPAETETRSMSLLLAPGRVYTVGFTACAGKPADLPEMYTVVTVPRAEQLTEYHFRPNFCAIAEMPENGTEQSTPVPVTEVTEELLRSGRAYFFASSSYEVTETVSDASLLVTLTDPNGVCYLYESWWVYAPEYMQEDVWYISLTQEKLTAFLDNNGYPTGVYSMAYYVNGDLADMTTFEIK